ncbi:MAG: DMT family transporter [Synergistaceae bacterium]|nr:DMT family transporter [Synergistaceae bacterium]
MRKMLADLGLLYCAVFWGASFVTMKILVGVYPACWLLFLRFSAASVMLYVFFRKRIHKSFIHELKGGVIIGAMLFVAIGTQTVGLNYIGGGRSAFISATYVLMVPLMLWLLKKDFPGLVKLFAAGLCVLGMYMLTGEDVSDASIWGDTLTVICALTFAVQVIAISRYTQGSDPIVLSFTEFVSFSVMSLVSSLVFESRASLLDMGSMYELLFTIVFATFGCYTMQVCAQKYADPSHATIIMSLESVFGLVSSIIFLGETLTFRAGVGCALIFVSVLISELEPYIRIRS